MRIGQKELEFPLIQGGMGVGVSLGNLAGHVAKCGGVGVISSVNAGYNEADFEQNPKEANLRALTAEIAKAKSIAKGKGLIGVNIMTAVSHYEETCRCAVKAGADIILSGAGLPLSLPQFLENSDVLCAPIVSSARAAKLLIKQYEKRFKRKPDIFVIEGHEAGGHLGFSNEELLTDTCKDNHAILKEVKEVAGDIPVFVAGGVYDGADMASYMKEGAAGVQIGTRFIATDECDADIRFKEAIVNAKEEDIAIIESPVGMPARAIISPLLTRLKQGEKFVALRCNQCLTACKHLEAPYCISRALIEAVRGNWQDGLFFTGSNGAKVDRIVSVEQLISDIKCEYEKAMSGGNAE